MEPTPELFSLVVCGVDGSGPALAAVRQVMRLRPPDGEVVLLAVSESRLAVHAGMLAGRAAEELDADARRGLEEAQAVAGGARTRIVHGRAPETLVSAVAHEGATLVAVGSHEHGRGLGYVLGSAGTRLLHDATCSVLLARPAPDPDRFPRAIVAGVDGSPSSLRAAAAAAEVGRRLGVPVEVLLAKGASLLDLDPEALAGSGLEPTEVAEAAVPALVGASAEADLVVVGSRGVRGVRALGSVGERVAHHARSSVLVVRAD